MQYVKKIRERTRHAYELTRDRYFHFFPVKVRDKDISKIINLDEIGISKIASIDDLKSSMLTYYRKRDNTTFYFRKNEKNDIVELLKTEFKENIKETMREADLIMAHKVRTMGSGRFDLGKDIDWLFDHHSERRWPSSHYKNYAIYNNVKGEKLYATKINRHHHLTTLARAYLYSTDLKYYQEVINQIIDWNQKNPFKMGMHWRSTLVCSNRVLSWIWCLALIGFEYVSKDTFWEILKSIYLHTMFIKENLSLHTNYPNNHLIGEAATLTIVGIFFPEFHDAERWKLKGLEILKQQLSQQFFDSGVHKEQAINYHLFVMEYYTHVYLLCRRNNIDCDFMQQKLERMYEYILNIYQPSGHLPMFGDNSEMKAVVLTDVSIEQIDAVFATGSVLFNRSDMKKLCDKFCEESLWLLTAVGYQKFQNLVESEIAVTSNAIKDAGVFVMRDGWHKESRYLALDCGPLGLGNKAGHGHADTLSFELWANGNKLIIDPGTYEYNGPFEWRQYFRGTSAHNTVIVDGLDQSEATNGPFGWCQLAQPQLNTWYSSNEFDFFEGEHDGYERLAHPVRHQRKILFIKGEYWILSDILTGKGKHRFECLFHFPPGQVFLDTQDKSIVKCNGQSNIKIVPLNNDIQAEVIEGCESPIQGWVSFDYGSKLKAPVLKYFQDCKTPAFFDVVLYPFIGNNEPKILVTEIDVIDDKGEIINQKEARCLKIQINEIEDYYLFSRNNSTVKYFDQFTTDGSVSYIRKLNNKTIRSLVIEGTFCSHCNIPRKTKYLNHSIAKLLKL